MARQPPPQLQRQVSPRQRTGLGHPQLQRDWEASKESNLPWTKAKAAIQDAYDRTVQLRKERCCSGSEPRGGPR